MLLFRRRFKGDITLTPAVVATEDRLALFGAAQPRERITAAYGGMEFAAEKVVFNVDAGYDGVAVVEPRQLLTIYFKDAGKSAATLKLTLETGERGGNGYLGYYGEFSSDGVSRLALTPGELDKEGLSEAKNRMPAMLESTHKAFTIAKGEYWAEGRKTAASGWLAGKGTNMREFAAKLKESLTHRELPAADERRF